MSGSATLTTVTSSSSMKIAAQATISVHHLRATASAPLLRDQRPRRRHVLVEARQLAVAHGPGVHEAVLGVVAIELAGAVPDRADAVAGRHDVVEVDLEVAPVVGHGLEELPDLLGPARVHVLRQRLR